MKKIFSQAPYGCCSGISLTALRSCLPCHRHDLVTFSCNSSTPPPRPPSLMEKLKAHSYSLANLRPKLAGYLRIGQFFLTSSNEMVGYHRQVCFAALLPLLYWSGVFVAYRLGCIHTVVIYGVMNFLFFAAACYFLAVVRRKLTPRLQVWWRCSFRLLFCIQTQPRNDKILGILFPPPLQLMN